MYACVLIVLRSAVPGRPETEVGYVLYEYVGNAEANDPADTARGRVAKRL